MWFVCDPCGLACCMFGYATVLFVNYVTVFQVLGPWFKWRGLFYVHTALFEAVILCILISYFRANTTDPGTVPKNTATEADIYPPADDKEAIYKPKRRFCEKCRCIKPPRAHHCSTCKRCVNRMDHHCPWVNNCVGSNNYKFFLLFIWWTFVGSAYAAVLSIWRFVSCWNSRKCAMPTANSLLLNVISTVLAVFFAIFVVAMWFDQWEGIITNTTAIESMKHWDEEKRDLNKGMTDVCGEPCGWRWFAPCWNIPRGSTGWYEWSKDADPDDYDPRDPIIQRHFARIEELLQRGLKPAAPGSREVVPREQGDPVPAGAADAAGEDGEDEGGMPVGCARPHTGGVGHGHSHGKPSQYTKNKGKALGSGGSKPFRPSSSRHDYPGDGDEASEHSEDYDREEEEEDEDSSDEDGDGVGYGRDEYVQQQQRPTGKAAATAASKPAAAKPQAAAAAGGPTRRVGASGGAAASGQPMPGSAYSLPDVPTYSPTVPDNSGLAHLKRHLPAFLGGEG